MRVRVCVSEFPQLAAVVHYRSARQLTKYNTLLHTVQLLTLQRQMMLDVGQQAVRLLQQMDPSDRSVNMHWNRSSLSYVDLS